MAASRLVPGGGLAAHEVAGGHTLARHVGLSVRHLAARMASNPNLHRASSFFSREVAESAIDATLRANSAQIEAWLASGKPELVVTSRMPSAVGRLLVRGETRAVEASSVRVVLRRATNELGYRIHTAYPIK